MQAAGLLSGPADRAAESGLGCSGSLEVPQQVCCHLMQQLP